LTIATIRSREKALDHIALPLAAFVVGEDPFARNRSRRSRLRHSRIKHFRRIRRIAARYEKTTLSPAAMLSLVATGVLLSVL
jgi:hypothetical protein